MLLLAGARCQGRDSNYHAVTIQTSKYWSAGIHIMGFLRRKRHYGDRNLPQEAIAAGNYADNGLLETSNGPRLS